MATLSVLYGSYRTNRQGIKAARFIVKRLQARGHAVHLIDAKEHGLPMLDKRHKEYETAPESMQRVHDLLAASDGFVLVSGEYNHGMPPGLKNLLDHFQREYYFKPCGIASYSAGPFGGVRVAMHLRNVIGELGMASISTIFAMSRVGESFDDEGNAIDGSYDRRVQQFLNELEWYVDAMKAARAKGEPF